MGVRRSPSEGCIRMWPTRFHLVEVCTVEFGRTLTDGGTTGRFLSSGEIDETPMS